MKLEKIIEDEAKGETFKEREHLSPDRAKVLETLDRLDGKACSSTLFLLDDDNYMSLGGGNDHRYVVFIAVNVDEKLYTLTTPDASSDETVDVVVGGQSGSYPKNQVVGKESARKALLYFCEHGKADPGLAWEIEE
jgi:hypothetical protein